MSYVFDPVSDADLEVNLALPGEYNFEVIKSERKVSKNGNPMAALTLKFVDGQNTKRVVFDYLVFSNINLNKKKISHFCKSVGLVEEYKKGEIPEELQGFMGKMQVGIQDEQPSPSGRIYPKKNIVEDYIFSSTPEINLVKNDNESFKDDDVPF